MAITPNAVLCRYQYDALDRLVSREPPGQASTQCFYQKTRLATQIQGQLQHSVFQHADQLLALHRIEEGAPLSVLLAPDRQRSVLHTLDVDGQQASIYTPYGHRRVLDVLTDIPGFSGERPDPVTGHYLLGNGYRAYNPVLMRFNSPDSLSPFGDGGLNAYMYCAGDPVNRVDPTGHKPWFPLVLVFGGAMVASIGGAFVFAAFVGKERSEILAAVGAGLLVGGLSLVGMGILTKNTPYNLQQLRRILNGRTPIPGRTTSDDNVIMTGRGQRRMRERSIRDQTAWLEGARADAAEAEAEAEAENSLGLNDFPPSYDSLFRNAGAPNIAGQPVRAIGTGSGSAGPRTSRDSIRSNSESEL